MTTLGESSSSNTSPRWGRTGDPGSAFSGLSRGRSRGRGAGGGSRGGRGGTRGGLSEVNIPSIKPDNSQSSTSKPSIPPSISNPTPGKSNVPAFSSKPKSTSRGSHAISVTAVPQINESVVTPSAPPPTPAKVTHKRRRSQAGKPALHVPPKANPPKSTHSPLRSNKLHIESHTETLKDTPPHLNNKFDLRNDIDALVERVRAVAMNNRPSTPKSHINWAVDDDDTLPDLDDWGVTASTLTTQLEGISPIIVDGLRSLPEFATNSTIPSPLKQVEAVTVQPIIDAHPSSVNGVTPDKVIPPNPLTPQEEGTKSKFPLEFTVKHDPQTTTPLNLNTTAPQFNSDISLHPSLPVEPLSVDSIVQHTSKSRPRASPMQFVPHPKSPIISMMDLSEIPKRSPTAKLEQADVREPVEIAFEMTDHKTAARTPEPRRPEHLIVAEPTITEFVISNLSPVAVQELSPSGSGLSASMHAPTSIVSASSDLSDSHAHTSIHTHTRAHTIGRSPLPDLTIYEQGSRVTRPGHTMPRSGSQETSHIRTHSNPPGGAHHHRSPHTSRPIITGDAISRLARTIGKAHNNFSSPISHSTVTPDS